MTKKIFYLPFHNGQFRTSAKIAKSMLEAHSSCSMKKETAIIKKNHTILKSKIGHFARGYLWVGRGKQKLVILRPCVLYFNQQQF